MHRPVSLLPILLVCGAQLPCGGALRSQELAWLPPQVAEGAALQLAERMRLLGEAEPDEARLLEAARRVVGSMVEVLHAWGVDGVLERAPDPPGLEIAAAGDALLDAMARYQICNLLLALQLEDPAYREDMNARITSVFGLSAVTLAVVRLREPFHAGGGDDAAIEAHLAGPALEPLFAAIQQEPQTRARAEEGCEPVVFALLEEPLSQLGPG
jgi:hypothetical protein